ncbi:MAG: MmcQ/YjbR family DNA-binding protein [Deltaproteobacteria bacterium]|nr:MmcQ/YjbR family DNA-binding protein [Deltaproteobacteria bacterium]
MARPGARTQSRTDAAVAELRAFGLAYPGAHTKSPWPGHLDLPVNDKTFAYLPCEGQPFHVSCKLPRSSAMALLLPFVKPAAYGLGKSGWVDATPPSDVPLPMEMFKEWIDESYRAQAPKKLVAQLDAKAGSPPKPASKAKATSAPKKPASKTAKKTASKRRI